MGVGHLDNYGGIVVRTGSSAFLSFVFICKLRDCNTKEATSVSYLCLFLLFCLCLPGLVNLPNGCCGRGLAGSNNRELRKICCKGSLVSVKYIGWNRFVQVFLLCAWAVWHMDDQPTSMRSIWRKPFPTDTLN